QTTRNLRIATSRSGNRWESCATAMKHVPGEWLQAGDEEPQSRGPRSQSLYPGEVPHPGNPLEVGVEGPDGGVVLPGSREDDAVGQRQLVLNPGLRCGEFAAGVELSDPGLIHLRRDVQRLVLASLLDRSTLHLDQYDG